MRSSVIDCEVVSCKTGKSGIRVGYLKLVILPLLNYYFFKRVVCSEIQKLSKTFQEKRAGIPAFGYFKCFTRKFNDNLTFRKYAETVNDILFTNSYILIESYEGCGIGKILANLRPLNAHQFIRN